MIRKLLATTAISTLIATSAIAQTATTTTPAPAADSSTTAPATNVQAATPAADGQLSSNIVGETVYNGTGDNAENIGEVNDLVIGSDGSVDAIIIGVGGFLGIGEKDVAVDYSTIDWAERDGDRWIVISATADQLKALPDFDRSVYSPAVAASNSTAPSTTAMAPASNSTAAPAGTAAAPATNNMAAAPATNNTMATNNNATSTDGTSTAAIDKTKLQPLNTAEIRSEELVGTTVYGANDENVGEIGDVVLTQDGKVDSIILDVGGFLGMGEKEVAVGMDNLSFLADEDGDKYLYTSFTKEQLDAAPAYDKATFADRRNDMRIVAPNG